MDIDFLVKLAENSPGVILTFLALYLFKVVVNDIKHDVEAMKLFMQSIDKTLIGLPEHWKRTKMDAITRDTPYKTECPRIIRGVVLHHTGTKIVVERRESGSWHYIVDRDGTVYNDVPDEDVAWDTAPWANRQPVMASDGASGSKTHWSPKASSVPQPV